MPSADGAPSSGLKYFNKLKKISVRYKMMFFVNQVWDAKQKKTKNNEAFCFYDAAYGGATATEHSKGAFFFFLNLWANTQNLKHS